MIVHTPPPRITAQKKSTKMPDAYYTHNHCLPDEVLCNFMDQFENDHLTNDDDNQDEFKEEKLPKH